MRQKGRCLHVPAKHTKSEAIFHLPDKVADILTTVRTDINAEAAEVYQ